MTGSTSQSPLKYVPELDGFRAIGMLFVLWAHFGLGVIHYWFPVQGFFVLSGYLISGILFKEKDKGHNFGRFFSTYWWRRMLRIFPVYYLYVFIIIAAYFISGYPSDLNELVAGLLTYTFNFQVWFADIDMMHSETLNLTAHLWTMSVEEQFYLFLPILIFLASKKWMKFWCVFFIVGSIAFRYFMGEYMAKDPILAAQTTGLMRLFTFSHLDAFFLGVAMNSFNLLEKKVNWWFWTFVCAAVLLLLGAWNTYDTIGTFIFSVFISNIGLHLMWHDNYEYVWSFTLIDLAYMLSFLAVIKQTTSSDSIIGKFLRFPLLTLFGKLSYGMYVYHMGVSYFFATYIFPQRSPDFLINFCWFIVYVVVLFAISWVSYEYFEKYFLNRKPAYSKATKSNP